MLTEVLETSYQAKHDLYGQLYLHVRGILLRFCERLATLKLKICLFQMNAVDFPDHITKVRDEGQNYDRIEVRSSLVPFELTPQS